MNETLASGKIERLKPVLKEICIPGENYLPVRVRASQRTFSAALSQEH